MYLGANIYVYGGEYGLPSIDFDCLRALCLVKFMRCPIEICTKGCSIINPSLPYLQIGNKKFIGYRRIKDFLDKENYAVDKSLTESEKQSSQLYSNWVFTNLHAYFNYFLFLEPNNYEITRTLYSTRTPFPFNFYYPATYQKKAHEIVLAMGGFDYHDKPENHDVNYLTLTAKKCVNTLSKKLGRKLWFFGDNFSELDAIVYSYLAVLFKFELPNNPLQSHIKGCKNLVNFINRISKDIFRSEAITLKKHSKVTESYDSTLTPTERHFLESEKKTKILAGMAAVIAMIAFAAFRGLHLQLSGSRYNDLFDDDDDELGGEEDDMD